MAISGLPYKKDIQADFYENGGTVDFSKVKFPTMKTLEENMKSAFVYLRNTGYKVDFIFQNMSYQQKEALLKTYLLTNIDYEIPELNETWLSILYSCVGLKVNELNCILDDLQLMCFTSENHDLVHSVWQFVMSLPLFVISKLDVETDMDAEKTDEDFNLVNFYHILKHKAADGLFTYIGEIPPKFYTKVFTKDNEKLLEALKDFTFMGFIYGICMTNEEEFKEELEKSLQCLTTELSNDNSNQVQDNPQ